MEKEFRICILGNSGTGKSTLAKELGQKLNIPVYHLDRELLHGNFQKLPPEERAKKHQSLISNQSWIIDGNYRRDLPERLNRATHLIFINTSRATAIPRVLFRAITGSQDPDTVPDHANRQTLSWPFIKFVFKYKRSLLKDLKIECQQKNISLIIVNNQPLKKMVVQILDSL